MKKVLIYMLKKTTRVFEGTGIGKNKLVFGIYKKMLSILKPRIVITEGSKMYLDKNDSLLLLIYNNFEPSETKLIKKIVKPGMVVVDAGAHIGYFTLLLSRLVGEKGKVYAFEPEKNNYLLLQRNVKLNNYKNIVLNNMALSNKVGKTKLFISDENPQDHRIVDDRKSRRYELIKSVSLDSYFRNNSRVDFIKMDIQGAEALAFEGSKKVFSKNKKLEMIIEFWPYVLSQLGKKPNDFLNDIKKLGSVKLIDIKSGVLKSVSNMDINSKSPQVFYNLFITYRT